MAFANGTLVHVDNDITKPIEQFIVQDLILVFDYTSESLENPRQLPVDFSSGTQGGIEAKCVVIVYKPEDELQKLICTPDQQFLMKDGTMKLASKLVPGQDSLLMISDQSVLIEEVIVGEVNSGLHNVSVSEQVPAEINGNLIVANGIICGDYALQLTPPSPEY